MVNNMANNSGTFNVRARARQVVEHHYDDEKPGKPLYLLIPGGLIALASLALVVYVAYLTWFDGRLAPETGLTLLAFLAPFYIGGVFVFSYGYELYDLGKALRLAGLIVFITLASVVIIAVLFLSLGAMGERSDSRRSLRSRSSSGPMGMGLPWPILLGGLGAPRPVVTREVIRVVPAEPQAPQPVQCPYCASSYLPAQTNFTCPNCGAPAPTQAMPADSNV
jgi:hypothetical protein